MPSTLLSSSGWGLVAPQDCWIKRPPTPRGQGAQHDGGHATARAWPPGRKRYQQAGRGPDRKRGTGAGGDGLWMSGHLLEFRGCVWDHMETRMKMEGVLQIWDMRWSAPSPALWTVQSSNIRWPVPGLWEPPLSPPLSSFLPGGLGRVWCNGWGRA